METSLLFSLTHPLPHPDVGGTGSAPIQPQNLGTPSRGAVGSTWAGGAHARGGDCPRVCFRRVRVHTPVPSCVTSHRCRGDPIEHMAQAPQHRGGSTLVAMETAIIVAFFS